MPQRNYVTITQDDIDAKVAANLNSRELELASYDFERATHEAAIAALGDIAWDDTTTPYKGLTRDAMITRALGDGLDSDTIQKIGSLLALDYHKLNLEAVKIETAKSEQHYNTLLTVLPAGPQRDAALATLATPVVVTTTTKTVGQ